MVRDVVELVAALRKRLAAEPAGSSGDTLRGQIAGLESNGRATLPCDPAGGSRKFLAGFLAGHLYAYLIRTRGSLPGTFLVPAATYAASLVSPQAERYLVDAPPQNLFKAHGYACLRVAERTELPADLELAAFHWLADQLAVPFGPELETRFREVRARRLSLAAEREADRTADPEAATEHRVERRLAELGSAVQRQLADLDPASTDADRLRGALVGLESASGSGLLRAPHSLEGTGSSTSDAYRGGMLGARLLAALVREDRIANDTLRRHAYRYGAVLASAGGRALLAEPPPKNVLKAHQLAIHTLTERAGQQVSEDVEIAMLRWLATQAGVALTRELVEERRRFVVKARRKA